MTARTKASTGHTPNESGQKWRRWAIAGTSLLFGYLSLAGHALLPFPFRFRYWVCALVAFTFAAAYAADRWLALGSCSRKSLRATVVSWSILLTLLTVDIAYAVYFNVFISPQLESENDRSTRLISSIELRESLPRVRYESGLFYKPFFGVSAPVFGDLCAASDLQSETIRERVLESRQFDIRVDEHGFRRSIPLQDADSLIVGDSFAFGSGLESQLTVAARLTQAGFPTYNAGYDGCGLVAQINHLNWLFDRPGAPPKLSWIIWTIFEGNDLEDSINPSMKLDTTSVFDNSVLGGAIQGLEAVRDHSILARAVSNRLFLLRGSSHRVVDGILIRGLYYESQKFGPKLFYPPHLERAIKPAEYVDSHPNLPRIQRSMLEMKSLAEARSARVLVVLVPTAVRIHGPNFTDFPEIEPPHFLETVEGLAGLHGFTTLNLIDQFRRNGNQRLLYFKDDTHWNADGHELAFELIQPIIELSRQEADELDPTPDKP